MGENGLTGLKVTEVEEKAAFAGIADGDYALLDLLDLLRPSRAFALAIMVLHTKMTERSSLPARQVTFHGTEGPSTLTRPGRPDPTFTTASIERVIVRIRSGRVQNCTKA